MQKVIQNRSLTRALVGAIDERKMHSPDAWGKYFGCVYREGCEKKRGCRPSLLRFQDLLAALRRGAPRIFWARMRGGLAQRRRGADRPGRALLMQACWKAERARILTPSPVAPMAASTLEWPLPSAPPLGRAELGRAGLGRGRHSARKASYERAPAYLAGDLDSGDTFPVAAQSAGRLLNSDIPIWFGDSRLSDLFFTNIGRRPAVLSIYSLFPVSHVLSFVPTVLKSLNFQIRW